MGHFSARLLCSARHDRLPSRAGSRSRRRPPSPTTTSATMTITTAPSCWPPTSVSISASAPALGDPEPPVQNPAVRLSARRTATTSISNGFARQSRGEILQALPTACGRRTMQLHHLRMNSIWQSRSMWKHFKGVKPAVMTVGGWFDAEDLQGPLRTFDYIEKNTPSRRQHACDGTLDARRILPRRWRPGGKRSIRFEDSPLLPRAHRVSVLRPRIKGQGDGSFPRRGSSRPERTMAALSGHLASKDTAPRELALYRMKKACFRLGNPAAASQILR